MAQSSNRFQDPNPGLLGLLPQADLTLLASGAVVFGVQRLVPTYDDKWYKTIVKPRWNPPNWVFPAVWIPLKVLQSVSLWLVLKEARTREQLALPLALFGAHLLLGNWWNVVFFGKHKMKESLSWMGVFWMSIAGSIASFSQVSPLASMLLVPTQIWVTIAAKLNYDIVKLNTTNAKVGKVQ
eukprot:jgi/Chrzof1/834/Cz01g30180.t1